MNGANIGRDMRSPVWGPRVPTRLFYSPSPQRLVRTLYKIRPYLKLKRQLCSQKRPPVAQPLSQPMTKRTGNHRTTRARALQFIPCKRRRPLFRRADWLISRVRLNLDAASAANQGVSLNSQSRGQTYCPDERLSDCTRGRRWNSAERCGHSTRTNIDGCIKVKEELSFSKPLSYVCSSVSPEQNTEQTNKHLIAWTGRTHMSQNALSPEKKMRLILSVERFRIALLFRHVDPK